MNATGSRGRGSTLRTQVLVGLLLEATNGRIKMLKGAIPANATHLMVATTLGTTSKQVMMNG
jgi:hypothetical protein